MANEITFQAGVTYLNGNHKVGFASTRTQITQSTAGSSSVTQTIGTSEEDISLGDITAGPVMLQNLDTTNYVQLGPKSGGAMIPMLKISAGQTAGPFILDSAVTMRAVANTSACKLLIWAANN